MIAEKLKKWFIHCNCRKNKDGHDYINDAIKAGANAIICEKNINIETNIPIIKVTSTINALGSLALANRIKNKIFL